MEKKRKISVVTGATSGIGFETARALVEKGFDVIILARNREKGETTLDILKRLNPEVSVHLIMADVSKQREIRSAARQILEIAPVLDVLVNNAGTWISKRTITEDNIETVFAVNHIAYFLLTHLLYPAIAKAPNGRIINVSSDSHFQTGILLDNLSLKGKYHGLRSYAQSKLANVMFVYEFERRKTHESVDIYAVQPGLVKTDIGVKHTTWLHTLAWKVRRSGGVSPAEGAATSIFLATSDEAKGQSGKYWDKCKPKKTSEKSYVEEDWVRLWKICEEMCGIEEYFSRS